jgi:hypothetical protein
MVNEIYEIDEITDEYLMELEAYINSDEINKWSRNDRIKKLAYDVKLGLFGVGNEAKQPTTITLGQVISIAAKGIDKLKDFAMKYVKKMMFPKAMQVGAAIANLLKGYTSKSAEERKQIASQVVTMAPQIKSLLHPNVVFNYPNNSEQIMAEIDKGYGMKAVPMQVAPQPIKAETE